MSSTETINQVILIGAGFSRAIMGEKALLTDEIVPKLTISKFPEIIEDYEKTFPDIEQFISLLDLRYLHFEKANNSLKDKLNKIRKSLTEQIVDLFDVGQLCANKAEYLAELKQFVGNLHKGSVILTLNYDCVLDQALYESKRWSPRGGYYISSFPADDSENSTLDNILLLKLHGSVNFRLASEELANNIGSIDKQKILIEITDKIFSGIPSKINDRNSQFYAKLPYVLVMSYIKKFNKGIFQVWDKAIEELKKADTLTIIGCSLRDEDTFLRFALRHFGEKENTQEFIIEVIDRNKEIRSKIKDELVSQAFVGNPDRQTVREYKSLTEYFEKNC